MSLSLLITMVVVIVVVCIAMWFLESYVLTTPNSAPYKVAIRVLVGLFIFLYILSSLGLWHGFAAGR